MKVTCIIPAYNEESTIKNVLETALKVKTIDEIIVVDDGSKDNTSNEARKLNVNVIQHEVNKGKGAAIKTGITHAKGEILLFLDADLSNISPKKIASIIQPLKNNEADFVKTKFTRRRGRVTELVVKPLFKVIFPFINIEQPLSGQFAVKKELLKNIKIDDKWGVDIQILLQLMKKKVRLVEVDIGKLKHKKQPIESLTIMSEQVIKSILEELGIIANKHKLILFDFDKTMIKESSIEIIAKEFGFTKKLNKLRKEHKKEKIKDYEITYELAKFFQGRRSEDFEKIYSKLHLSKNITKVVDKLKKRRYQIGIISLAFNPIVEHFAKKLSIPKENIISPTLIKNSYGKYTGEVTAKTKYNSECCDMIFCKHDAAKEIMSKLGIKSEECIGIGDGKSDKCLFRSCGLSLCYKNEIETADIIIDNLAEILIYAE